MNKAVLPTKDDMQLYYTLRKECDELLDSMKQITPDTDSKERDRIVSEYDNKRKELNKVRERMELSYMNYVSRIMRLRTKSDGSDIKGFDEDIKEFDEALYDYFESCKARLNGMLDELRNGKINGLSLKRRYDRWALRREIEKEIRMYSERQQLLNH